MQREDRDSLRKSHAVTVRTLEMTRVAGARVVLLHSWLQTMGKSTDAASEPPVRGQSPSLACSNCIEGILQRISYVTHLYINTDEQTDLITY